MFPGTTADREGAAAVRDGDVDRGDAADSRGGRTDHDGDADARGRDPDHGPTTIEERRNFVVVGAPLDVSTTFRPGARFGPRRIRQFAEPYDDYDRRTGRQFSELGVRDRGDVRAWDDAADYLEYLEGTLRDVVWDDAIPLLLGGEHTVALAGTRAVDPDVVVCLDAHLDLRDAFDGNPLSHACVTRRILEEPGVDEVLVVGARTGSEAEWERAGADDVTVVPPADATSFDYQGRLAGRDAYLSVDVDAADPAYAPGTGTMEPFGLEPRELRHVVRAVAPLAAGFDVVEVNDRDDGEAAALAGKLVREFVFSRAGADS